jgi:hypothetical protein
MPGEQFKKMCVDMGKVAAQPADENAGKKNPLSVWAANSEWFTAQGRCSNAQGMVSHASYTDLDDDLLHHTLSADPKFK